MFYTWQLRLASEAGTHVAQGPVQSDCRGPASPSVAVTEWGEHGSLSSGAVCARFPQLPRPVEEAPGKGPIYPVLKPSAEKLKSKWVELFGFVKV